MDSARPTPEDDAGATLMLAWRAGDESAFERLVETYSGRAYALATRFLGEVAGREDLVQEAFLRVFRARDRYQPTALFSTWLYRIVYNLCANVRERRREMMSLEGAAEEGSDRKDFADERALDPAAGLESMDVVGAVRAAIASLPENQRMALILAKYEEFSLAEIAVVLDSSQKAVKSLVHRARENLRSRLAPWLLEEAR